MVCGELCRGVEVVGSWELKGAIANFQISYWALNTLVCRTIVFKALAYCIQRNRLAVSKYVETILASLQEQFSSATYENRDDSGVDS